MSSRKVKINGVQTKFAFDKSKKYKYNKSGGLEEATTIADDDIIMSGSKSSLRRMADLERNISILATKLMTTDGGATDAEDSNYDRTESSDIRFKGSVRMGEELDMRDTIDMNNNRIHSLATPTSGSDAATKSYVDARESAAESTASADATSKANAAKSQAISTAASDATTKANAAKAAAIAAVTNGAGAAFDTLVEIQNAMATDSELSSAISSVTSSAAATASADATSKANAALAAAKVYADAQDTNTHRAISNSVTSTSSTVSASSAAVKTAYDRSWPNTTYSAGNGISLSGTQFLMSGSYSGNFTATGDITAYSDDSLKTNVQVIDGALGRVEAIRGVTFDRIEDGSTSTGVIAQELLAVLPEAVHTDANGVHSVAYGNITGLLIEAVKELSAQVAALKTSK